MSLSHPINDQARTPIERIIEQWLIGRPPISKPDPAAVAQAASKVIQTLKPGVLRNIVLPRVIPTGQIMATLPAGGSS